jgi:TetR/AcrR family transcriptional regulator, copper-responsive repressor
MTPTPKKRGRPRAFDDAVVLARATETFLKFGYSGTSLDALTTAMGLNKPSLYAAFGDKRRLFVRVVEELAVKRGRRFRMAFERGDTLEASLREMFLEAVDIYVDPETPPGCLMVSGGATEATVDEGFADLTREFFALSDRVVATWIAERAPDHVGVPALMLSRLVNGVIHDLALRARVGESRARLREYARGAATALSKC